MRRRRKGEDAKYRYEVRSTREGTRYEVRGKYKDEVRGEGRYEGRGNEEGVSVYEWGDEVL